MPSPTQGHTATPRCPARCPDRATAAAAVLAHCVLLRLLGALRPRRWHLERRGSQLLITPANHQPQLAWPHRLPGAPSRTLAVIAAIPRENTSIEFPGITGGRARSEGLAIPEEAAPASAMQCLGQLLAGHHECAARRYPLPTGDAWRPALPRRRRAVQKIRRSDSKHRWCSAVCRYAPHRQCAREWSR